MNNSLSFHQLEKLLKSLYHNLYMLCNCFFSFLLTFLKSILRVFLRVRKACQEREREKGKKSLTSVLLYGIIIR